MAEVGGFEQTNIPRDIECGGGTIMGNPGDNLRWDSVAWLLGIPKGAK